MTKCERCGDLRTFENISCRRCAKYDHDRIMAIADKDSWRKRVKFCACGEHANVIYYDRYLCGSCHDLSHP